jgi:hypothetical protein
MRIIVKSMENDEERLGIQFLELEGAKDLLDEKKRQERDRQVEADMKMVASWLP